MAEEMQQRLQFEAGQVIFSEGDRSDLCYQIFRGRVRIVLNAGPAEKTVAELGPGDVFGEMGIIDDGPRSGTAVADVETVCIGYHPDDILRQIDHDPATMKSVMKTLIQRLREANKTIGGRDPGRSGPA